MVFALQTLEQIQNLELIQPNLAWKALEVIKKTLEATTQWARQVAKYPLQKHHVSRFPWSNHQRLREEVTMDTIFMQTPGLDGSICGQVFIGLMSRMINFYPMKSKEAVHVVAAYQDFMRYEGVPEGLHRDGAPEEKVQKIMDINREMRVKDTWSEAGHPNEIPAEALGVNPLKRGVEVLMNRTGADDRVWPWAYMYFSDINNICSTPILGWKTPVSVHHGYTPDISSFLLYQFWELIYFKIDKKSPSTKELEGRWLGVSKTIGDILTYDILPLTSMKVIQKSSIQSVDPKKTSIINKQIITNTEDDEELLIEEEEVAQQDSSKPVSKPNIHHGRTNKHKVKWHDTEEASYDKTEGTTGFHNTI